MSVTIEVQPTPELWQQFYAAHYAADPRLKVRFWFGLACLVIGAFTLSAPAAARIPAVLLLLFGLYGVLSRQLLLLRSLRKIASSPQALRAVTYCCDANGLTARGEAGSVAKRWSDFSGYRLAAPGLLLYRPDGSFLFLPRQGCAPGAWVELERLLERSRLPRK